MHSRLFFLALILILLTSCLSPPTASPSPADISQDRSRKECGDAICDGPETVANCPEDCIQPDQEQRPPPPTSDEGREQFTRILNPTSGVELSVIILAPEAAQPERYPTVVLVPGGSGSGEDFTRPGRTIRQQLNELGFLVVVFDPDGRGRSEGNEDHNGFIHQDGLAAVIRYAADHPLSDGQGIGLVSYSFA